MDVGGINAKLVDGGGACAMVMRELREAAGMSRLGTRVMRTIAGSLAESGIGHLPRELPNRQDAFVLLYQVDGPAGTILGGVERSGT